MELAIAFMAYASLNAQVTPTLQKDNCVVVVVVGSVHFSKICSGALNSYSRTILCLSFTPQYR